MKVHVTCITHYVTWLLQMNLWKSRLTNLNTEAIATWLKTSTKFYKNDTMTCMTHVYTMNTTLIQQCIKFNILSTIAQQYPSQYPPLLPLLMNNSLRCDFHLISRTCTALCIVWIKTAVTIQGLNTLVHEGSALTFCSTIARSLKVPVSLINFGDSLNKADRYYLHKNNCINLNLLLRIGENII